MVLRQLLVPVLLLGSFSVLPACASEGTSTGAGSAGDAKNGLSAVQIDLLESAHKQLREDYDAAFVIANNCPQGPDEYEPCRVQRVEPRFDAADERFEQAIRSVMETASTDCRAALEKMLLKTDDLGIGIKRDYIENNVVEVCT